MSNSDKNDNSLIHVGSIGLAKVNNALRITENLLNSFDSVVIGEQEWMTRNLNVSRFRNGDLIPEVQDHEEWAIAGREGRPAWCYYDNDPDNGKIYGKLYNWYAVNDSRGLTSAGWRVPNKEDFETLVDFLGGWECAGQKLKEVSDQPLIPPFEPRFQLNYNPTTPATIRLYNAQAKINDLVKKKWEKRRDEILAFKKGTNESGFNALLSGFRFSDAASLGGVRYFYQIEFACSFWCSNEFDDDTVWILSLASSGDEAGKFHNPKKFGFSVRCIKEQ